MTEQSLNKHKSSFGGLYLFKKWGLSAYYSIVLIAIIAFINQQYVQLIVLNPICSFC